MFGNSNHVSLAICTGQKHILKFEGMSFGDDFRRFIAAQSECGMWIKSLKFWSGVSTVLTQSDNQDTPSHILIPQGLIRQKSSRNNKSCSNLIILLFQSGQDNMHFLLWKVKAHHSATVMAWRFIFRLWTNMGLFKFLTKCNNNCDATLILHLFLNNTKSGDWLCVLFIYFNYIPWFAYSFEKMWCHHSKHKAIPISSLLALCRLYCYLTLVNKTFSETSSPSHWWIYSSTFEWPSSKMLV